MHYTLYNINTFKTRNNRGMLAERLLRIILANVILALFSLPTYSAQPLQGNALVLKTKGDALYDAGRFTEALDYYTAGMDKAKAEKNDEIYYACIGNIGNVYGKIGDFKRARHYYMRGYKASLQSKNTEMQWKAATNLVAVCCITGDLEGAKAFFKVQMQLPISDVTMKKYYFLTNQAYIATARNNNGMAVYYTRQALEYAKEKAMPRQYLVSLYTELGNLKMRSGDAKGAIESYDTALDNITEKEGKAQTISVYKYLESAYAKIGKPDSAKKYHNLYLNLSDSVFNMAQLNVANGKLFEYENRENASHISRLVSQNYALIAAVAVFLALVVTLTLLYRALRKKNRRLEESQQALVEKNKDLMQSDDNNRALLDKYINAINELRQAQKESQAQTQAKDERTGTVLGDEQKNRLLKSIMEVMENVAVISAPDFDMKQLAERVGSNQNYVSYVINDTYGKNFRSLLNEYRIREAVKRISDREKYGNVTMQAIYEELGWKSAASFISAFKKVNGMTPSEYQKAMIKK